MNENNIKVTASAADSTVITDLSMNNCVDADAMEHCRMKITSALGLPSEYFNSASTEVVTLSTENTKSIEKIKAINPTIIVNTSNTTKPCYSIMYYDMSDNTWHIGYSSYELSYVRQWLAECFEPIEADVRPVTYGQWNDGICSNCGSENHDCPKFCSSCGAEMVL